MYSVLCILSKCHNSLFFYTQFSYMLLIYGMASNLFLRDLTKEIKPL